MKKRTGAIVLELIVGLPVLIIALLAIVELGLLSSNQAMVHAASRAAADAAVSVGCDMPTDGEVPSEILDAVEKVLEARGMTASCVRVEHTNGPDPPYLLTNGDEASPPAAEPLGDNYVCVSVCVENTELAPNLLEAFCVDLDDTFSQQTVCRCLPPCPEETAMFDLLVEAESDEANPTVGGPYDEGWIVWSNGEICFNATLPADGTYTFSSRLWASQGGPDLANAAFIVDGVQVADFDIVETSHATAGVYSFDVVLPAGDHEFCVAFTNDFFMPPIDRNLFVDWMSISGPN